MKKQEDDKPKPLEFNIHVVDSINEVSQAGSASSVSANSPSATSSESNPLLVSKYDLSEKAYLLVLHHYMFENSRSNRAGSEKDMEKIERFFRDYRVDQHVHENKTAVEVEDIMDKIARQNFKDYSCLIIIIMSHGTMDDQIQARDGKTYCIEEDVVEKCTSNESLNGKPKLFIVQACRGDSLMATDATKPMKSNKHDVLIFQSTYKGFVALRNEEKGTFFIQNFFNLLDEHRDKDISLINQHLNRLFRTIFAKTKTTQSPTMTTTLARSLIFGDLRRP